MPETSPTLVLNFYVSFSSEDGLLAERIGHCLEQLGHTVEVRDTDPSKDPGERLTANGARLANSQNLVAVYTARYKSDKEAHSELLNSFARATGSHRRDHDYILVVYDCEPDINFQASTYIDLRRVPEADHAESIRKGIEKRKGKPAQGAGQGRPGATPQKQPRVFRSAKGNRGPQAEMG